MIGSLKDSLVAIGLDLKVINISPNDCALLPSLKQLNGKPIQDALDCQDLFDIEFQTMASSETMLELLPVFAKRVTSDDINVDYLFKVSECEIHNNWQKELLLILICEQIATTASRVADFENLNSDMALLKLALTNGLAKLK